MQKSGDYKDTFHKVVGEGLASKRIKMYLKGGVCSITYKVLIVDLIARRIDPNLVTSIVINLYQRIKESDSDEFIVRCYRDGNLTGGQVLFITDRPHVMTEDGLSEL